MIEENSGKFFRFKLDFDLGYGFAEVYNLTDTESSDGIIVIVYNRHVNEIYKKYLIEEVTTSGLALGPIRLYKYPNSRGVGSWEYLFKSNKYIIEQPNITKAAQDLAPWVYDWDSLKRWHKSDWDTKKGPIYVQYSQIRNFETGILNSNLGVVKKFTMKILIDAGNNISKYYDLSELET